MLHVLSYSSVQQVTCCNVRRQGNLDRLRQQHNVLGAPVGPVVQEWLPLMLRLLIIVGEDHFDRIILKNKHNHSTRNEKECWGKFILQSNLNSKLKTINEGYPLTSVTGCCQNKGARCVIYWNLCKICRCFIFHWVIHMISKLSIYVLTRSTVVQYELSENFMENPRK